jgi:urocanate hydratase
MGSNLLTNNPFAVLTFIAAPALLTNASCVLALSTINRLIRTRDSMHQLLNESENTARPQRANFIEHVNRVERQATLLLGALRWIYVGLGAFVSATLVTLLGAVAGESGSELAMKAVVGAGLLLGVIGVAGLVGGCVHLFRATQLSLINIREEAESIRARQEQLKNAPRGQGTA